MTSYFVLIWIVGWSITWPALLANFQNTFPTAAQKSFREEIGMAMFFAILPPVWIAAPFVTGFYEHGFQFRRMP